MSELKVYRFLGSDEVRADATIGNDFYLKSEADKVIADKDAKILALDAEVSKQKHHAKLFLGERNYAEARLWHSNHKRCLAMAKWCECKRIDAANYRIPREKWEFYDKWRKRWLALAEEPTWAKFLQLIHKETK